MGLKGYRLWAMGQLAYNVQSPTVRSSAAAAAARRVVTPGLGLCTLNQVDP
jgi:hypothetical protein